MTQDESGQLSGLIAPTGSTLSVNTSAAGELSPQMDIDNKPVGRCFNELKRVKDAVARMRADQKELEAASAAFWKCRDAAKTVAGVAPANHYRGLYQASIFDSLADQITQLESMIENFQ